ncbi:MAG: hypothetical protein ACFE9I_09215 [Candidatus Hermodarchaeota archaeon]
MVKYYHCEKCKKIYSTATWIGEVHTYDGICLSCIEGKQENNQTQQEIAEDYTINIDNREHTEIIENTLKKAHSSPIEIEKQLLLSLVSKASVLFSGEGSIDVLIKEIKDELVDKAKVRIEETIQSFDAYKIDAQKVINYVEKTFDYLSEYKEYMDNVVKKLQDKPKMKVKTAIEKVYKDTIVNLPKEVAKDVLLNKKELYKTVYSKAVKWYNFYSDIEDIYDLTKKMTLHPFNEVQKKLSTLPFYTSI